MAILRMTILCALVAGSLPAAAAAKGPIVKLDPNAAGRGSHLTVDAYPGNPGNGQAPRSVVVSAARGFKVDARARAARCSAAQARKFECPAASRIGGGTAFGHATGAIVPGGRYDFKAAIKSFLAPPQQKGDVAGVVVQVSEPTSGQRGTVTGRVVRVKDGPYGLELRFDNLGAAAPSYPGVTISIDHVKLRAGASRTVVRKRTVTRDGRRVTVRRKHRFDLITNPPKCAGAWPFRVTIGYADHNEETFGSAACSST
jgi:hypothetical protein